MYFKIIKKIVQALIRFVKIFDIFSSEKNFSKVRKDKKKELHNKYSREYINRKIKQHKDLFTNIDEHGHDLNRKQCEAIIKNERYNQVIAAAGTGKTLVLTYRIKYLIDEGIDPERILAITYTREASKEMKKRLYKRFNIKDVEVSTIHSLAYRIVRENSPYKLSVVSSNTVVNILESAFDKLIRDNDSMFRHYFYNYLLHKNDDYIDETEFEEKADYVAEMKRQRYVTLKGERVKSRAEKAIADFLYLHQVRYQYEKVAEWADRSDDRVVYQPDFYLVDYDIYIEHWGVNRQGEVPEWFTMTSQQYRNKIKWARRQFRKYNKKLIETFEFDYQENSLELLLEDKLLAYNVKLARMNIIDYIESIYSESKKDIIDDFIAFINTAKTYNIKLNQIDKLFHKGNKRQFYFGMCAKIMLFVYNEYLRANRLIDFNDMIHKAIEILKMNPLKYYSRYDHLLVDEFQDVGDSHIEFIKQLFAEGSSVKLFCVGDDWQSIYSFQGSEPGYFIDFDKYFGIPARTFLVSNFRCPKSILDAGNDLIKNNRNKIEKEVLAVSKKDSIPKLHLLTDDSQDYSYELVNYTAALVEKLLRDGAAPGDIMILSRNDDASPYFRDIKNLLSKKQIPYKGKSDFYNPADKYKEPVNAVSIYSVHQSKGREAKYVLIIHMVEDDIYSFPSPEKNNELIEPMISSSIDRIEEERRLFYVAITRAKDELHIISQRNNESRFVKEIRDHLELETSFDISCPDEELYISFTAEVYRLFDNVHKSQKQAGVLKNISNRTILFLSWKSCNPPLVKKGVWYKFRNVKLNEFNGKKQIIIDENSEVVEIYNSWTDKIEESG